MPDGSATAHLFRPKIITTLREGYSLESFRKDAVAGLTVAIVALPLSMAIAVASGVSPERGLYSSIVGGAVVSALGGSRFQIGGPAGAFIVLVAATVAKFGIDGLLLTVLLSGIMLIVLGIFRIGALIRHIPHAVTVGFTCGIAVTIAASQLKDLGGLRLDHTEPGPLLEKVVFLSSALSTFNPAALGLGLAVGISIFIMKYFRPNWPGMLIAIAAGTTIAAIFHFPVETIGTRFGVLPHMLQMPRMPNVTVHLLLQVLPAALSFTLLGGVESLLSAKVADSMAGRKHRSNMELVAQGFANMAAALFGGISVTGTIARTATNVRAGARSPMSGIMHAGFLMIFLFVAAPLASFVPLSALAGLLLVVCWNMAERADFRSLVAGEWRSASVLLATFAFTLLKDLTVGIVAGCVLAAIFTLLGSGVREEGD